MSRIIFFRIAKQSSNSRGSKMKRSIALERQLHIVAVSYFGVLAQPTSELPTIAANGRKLGTAKKSELTWGAFEIGRQRVGQSFLLFGGRANLSHSGGHCCRVLVQHTHHVMCVFVWSHKWKQTLLVEASLGNGIMHPLQQRWWFCQWLVAYRAQIDTWQ